MKSQTTWFILSAISVVLCSMLLYYTSVLQQRQDYIVLSAIGIVTGMIGMGIDIK